LEAAVTPYVVIPNDFKYPGLDTNNGGNVVAVIYNHQLEYAVFGDTGPTNLIGEASYGCAANLGINPDPAVGGVDSGVTYIVFVGPNTAPTDIENQAETRQLGASLAMQLISNN
jgi:Fungal chitosanase of glycosyl hydrolase group 75